MREVTIDDAFVSYYSHDGKNNFDVILSNVDKGKGPKEKKSGSKAAKDESSSAKKKVIIEHLRIAGTKVKLMKSDMMPALMLPSIELTDIGKKSGGATLEEAWSQIANAVMKSMSSMGDGLGAIGAILGDGTKSVSGSLDAGAKGAVGISLLPPQVVSLNWTKSIAVCSISTRMARLATLFLNSWRRTSLPQSSRTMVLRPCS